VSVSSPYIPACGISHLALRQGHVSLGQFNSRAHLVPARVLQAVQCVTFYSTIE
jgi:hypothetical protein